MGIYALCLGDEAVLFQRTVDLFFCPPFTLHPPRNQFVARHRYAEPADQIAGGRMILRGRYRGILYELRGGFLFAKRTHIIFRLASVFRKIVFVRALCVEMDHALA